MSKLEAASAKPETPVVKVEGVKAKNQTSNSNNNKPASNIINRDQQKELQKLQKQFSKLESSLNELNQQKINIEAELANPGNYADKNKFPELEERYKSVQQKIISANKEYEILFEKIMQLESEA